VTGRRPDGGERLPKEVKEKREVLDERKNYQKSNRRTAFTIQTQGTSLRQGNQRQKGENKCYECRNWEGKDYMGQDIPGTGEEVKRRKGRLKYGAKKGGG